MHKKSFPFFGITLIALCACALFYLPVSAAVLQAPSTTLRIGDSNIDVMLLQKILNASASTRISDTGLGSPGQETTFFGKKTFDAVKKFQALYATEVLFPQGITAPTGFVGKATLGKIQQIASQTQVNPISTAAPAIPSMPVSVPTVPSAPVASPSFPQSTSTPISFTPPASSSITPIPLTPVTQIPFGVNPNTINLEYAISVIKAESKKQGLSDEQILRIETDLRANAQSTADFRAQFFESMKQATGTMPILPTSMHIKKQSPLTKFLSFLHIVEVADAAVPTPFGGLIFYTFPCTCSPNAMIVISPLPPTFPTMLTYTYGTMLFLSYNLPLSTALLGFYTPAVQMCWMAGTPCYLIPSNGHITPIVGSAPA